MKDNTNSLRWRLFWLVAMIFRVVAILGMWSSNSKVELAGKIALVVIVVLDIVAVSKAWRKK